MRKLVKRTALCACIAALCWCGGLIADRQTLHEELIRLHVVANSDSQEDQALKLRVRDAVIASLSEAMENITDADQAMAYLQENLPKIQAAANRALAEAGSEDTAVVTLTQETFDTREYDTFTLPAGVYEALRITIGEGEGHNWWCVVFPTLCLPAAGEGFEDVAAGAGFPDGLTAALEGDCELRFFLLDAMGRLENYLFAG